MEKNFLERPHLVNIFLKKFKGIKFNSKQIQNDHLKEIKIHQNIVLEDLDKDIDEKLIYSLFNIIDLDNKFIIVTSKIPLVNINYSLKDLRSRTKNFYCIILKNQTTN